MGCRSRPGSKIYLQLSNLAKCLGHDLGLERLDSLSGSAPRAKTPRAEGRSTASLATLRSPEPYLAAIVCFAHWEIAETRV